MCLYTVYLENMGTQEWLHLPQPKSNNFTCKVAVLMHHVYHCGKHHDQYSTLPPSWPGELLQVHFLFQVDYVFISMKAGVQTWRFWRRCAAQTRKLSLLTESLFIRRWSFPRLFWWVCTFLLTRGARTVGRPNHTHRAALPRRFHYHSQWF